MLDDLLRESNDFHAALEALWQSAPPISDGASRIVVSAISALLSIEHATAARFCFATGLASSATAMIRLQYEAAVRSAWFLHGATDAEIDLMDRPLDNQSEDLARKLPGAPLMLKAMADRAPEGLLAPLQMFHIVSWRGLNSFVHAGVHPLRRQSDGFPTELACQLLRSSNAILHVTYRMLTVLTGSPIFTTAVTDLWKQHRNCLPIDPSA